MGARRAVRIAALAVLGAAGAVLALAPPPAAAATPSVSSNWAGYAVTGAKATPAAFTAVSGSWVVPSATCTAGSPTFSAAWVGLGGFADAARALEQIGTETDCTASGATRSSVWYELLPAPVRHVALAVGAGDTISASVQVSGTAVSLELRNLTRGTAFSKRLRMAAPDLSSAEWILEAPSGCGRYGGCRPLPLANFGTVSFSSASATAGGHTGSISDPAWSPASVRLASAGRGGFDPGSRWWRHRELPRSPSPGAIPSALSADGTSFSISWQSGAGSVPAAPPSPDAPYIG